MLIQFMKGIEFESATVNSNNTVSEISRHYNILWCMG